MYTETVLNILRRVYHVFIRFLLFGVVNQLNINNNNIVNYIR